MINISTSKLPGLKVIKNDVFPDNRGSFVKLFTASEWEKDGLATNFCESYYSLSHKNVIRGMHFQIPPHQHTKVVYVTRGRIMDVLLDIRVGSPTYGQYESFELSDENNLIMYIPPGIAHGFESMEDNSIVTYLQNGERSPESEGGIRTDSFGMQWNTQTPIMSDRDKQLPTLAEFKSPFSFS